MNIRATLTALVPVAVVMLSSGATGVHAENLPPMRAAELNAGTANTGIGPSGLPGIGVSAVVPDVAQPWEVQVAGIQLSYANESPSPTQSTTGSPERAALLNAGTAATALGPNGAVGEGVFAAAGAAEVAGIQLESGGEVAPLHAPAFIHFWAQEG
jgi:hypothetical protein